MRPTDKAGRRDKSSTRSCPSAEEHRAPKDLVARVFTDKAWARLWISRAKGLRPLCKRIYWCVGLEDEDSPQRGLRRPLPSPPASASSARSAARCNRRTTRWRSSAFFKSGIWDLKSQISNTMPNPSQQPPAMPHEENRAMKYTRFKRLFTWKSAIDFKQTYCLTQRRLAAGRPVQ